MSFRRAALLPLAVAVFCAACGRAPSSAALRFSVAGDPGTFDPVQQAEENSGTIIYLTSGVLLRIDRLTDQVRPELAESWTVGDEGKSIAFHLRRGLKFSDGSPLTADDVARSLRRAFDPTNGSEIADAFRSAGGLPDVEVHSPQQLTVRYSMPKAGLERLFDQLNIVRFDAASPRLPAGAGPFYVADYKAGAAVTLKRNPYYWKRDSEGRQLPYLDSIRLDIQSNRDIELERFLRGETDMIRKLRPEDFARVEKQMPGAARDMGPSTDSEFLWFNQAGLNQGRPDLPDWKKKWFSSAAFRHAISAAIDREDIARIVYLGHAHPAAGPISPANKYWFNAALKPLPFDAGLAMKTLQAAGFALRDGVLRDRDGHAVEFSLITNAGNQSRQQAAAMIQADLSKIGVKMGIVPLDFGSLMERIAKTSQYDACLLGFTNVAADPNDQTNFWLSSGQQHAWHPEQKTPATDWEARIDRLVMKQASETSRDLRREAFNEVQRIMVEQEPIIYLVNPDYLTAIGPKVRDFQFSPIYPQALANIETVRLK